MAYVNKTRKNIGMIYKKTFFFSVDLTFNANKSLTFNKCA